LAQLDAWLDRVLAKPAELLGDGGGSAVLGGLAMARDAVARSKAPGKLAEWVGGVTSLPAVVTGEGAAYRPDCLLWLDADGMVVGTTVVEPGGAVGAGAESLRNAIEKPAFGKPHTPARVRVASADLAAALKAAHPGIEIVCAPTPELDEAIASLQAHLARGDQRATYLSTGVDIDRIAALFRAAAALFRAGPWRVVPSDQDLIGVSIPELGVEDAVMSVIGQMGQSLGLMLFADLDDFDAFLESAEAIERGEEPRMPPSFSLNFDRGADLPRELRKEIAEHGWEVAGPNAFPWLAAVDEDLVSRAPDPDELTIAEVVARALPRLLSERTALLAAWNGGPAVSRTFAVDAHVGKIEVTFRVPPRDVEGARIPFDVLADLQALEGAGGIDEDAREDLEDELLDELLRSPEGEGLSDVGHCKLVMDIAAGELGTTIATLRAPDLRSIVFDFIPRHVDVEASQAADIVEQLACFYRFLDRKYELSQARACLRALERDAVAKLAVALSDPRHFGPGKLLIQEGRRAGFDMNTEQGVAAWMRVVQSRQGTRSAATSRGSAGARAKKSKRSAARNARRKNR
jgi:hypothetical protein